MPEPKKKQQLTLPPSVKEERPYFDDVGTLMLALMMGREIQICNIKYRFLRRGVEVGAKETGDLVKVQYPGIYAKSPQENSRWLYCEYRVGMLIEFLDKHMDSCKITA